jgi:hypothetical protein
MKNRLLITIIISTKEESGKNKEEKNWKGSLSAVGERLL